MNLVLVGFMASGKSAVARRLARRLGYTNLDIDHLIESEVGSTISRLFELKGEPFFRELETSLAEILTSLKNYVISTGGGILTTPGNLARLKKAGPVIFLKADPEEIILRLKKDTHRPIIKEGDLRENVTRLLEERMPQYLQSDIIIETGGKGVNRVSGEIIHSVSVFNAGLEKSIQASPPVESAGEKPPPVKDPSQSDSGDEKPPPPEESPKAEKELH